MTDPSRCIVRTKMIGHCVTTIKYQTGLGYSHESGIRSYDPKGFDLVQHGWPNARTAHAIVCLAVAKEWESDRISKVMEFIQNKNYFRKKTPRG